MATTLTGTATFSRFSLLKMQVRALLREVGGASEGSLDSVGRGLDAPHYIHQVAVHGLYPDGLLGAELRMKIDWRQHTIAVHAGGDTLQIPPYWRNAIAPSLDEASRTFHEAIKAAGLAVEWVVTYGAEFDRASVNRILGFVPAGTRAWRRPPDSVTLGFGPLTEASLVVSLAID